jgi:hypothetical protein
MGSTLCEKARTALVCDDGICGPLAWVLSAAGCDTYVLDPRSGIVIHDCTIGEALRHRDAGADLADHLLDDLPAFDLFLIGCASFAEEGYIYSPSTETKYAYRAIKRAGKIDFGTATTVVAPPRQITFTPYCKYSVAKAKFRIGPDGVHSFDWWLEHLANVAEQAHRVGVPEPELLNGIDYGRDFPCLKMLKGGPAKHTAT